MHKKLSNFVVHIAGDLFHVSTPSYIMFISSCVPVQERRIFSEHSSLLQLIYKPIFSSLAIFFVGLLRGMFLHAALGSWGFAAMCVPLATIDYITIITQLARTAELGNKLKIHANLPDCAAWTCDRSSSRPRISLLPFSFACFRKLTLCWIRVAKCGKLRHKHATN